jgi:hypothetical protein
VSIAEQVVELAAELSPARLRADRREQWLADLRDAGELGMTSGQVVRGAVRTALLHRRHVRRSTWEPSAMTTTTTVRPTPTIGLAGVLVAAAVLCELASVAFEMAFGGDHGSGDWQWYRFIAVDAALGSVLVALAVVAIVMAIRPSRLAGIASIALVAVAVLAGTMPVWLGPTLLPLDWVLPTVGLATWCAVVPGSAWRWALLVTPALASALVHLGAGATPSTLLPLADHVSALVALVVGIAAVRVDAHSTATPLIHDQEVSA